MFPQPTGLILYRVTEHSILKLMWVETDITSLSVCDDRVQEDAPEEVSTEGSFAIVYSSGHIYNK